MDLRLPSRHAITPRPAPGNVAPDQRLQIVISTAVGIGPTRLAAFDAALAGCGVADLNLVRLSSVIPPGSELLPGRLPAGGHEHGDLLYCVYADAYASTPGEQAWAGLAWSIRDDGSGAGLFVEHSGSSETVVNRDLHASLEDMSERRGGHYRTAGSRLVSADCHDHPVCALAIACYRVASW